MKNINQSHSGTGDNVAGDKNITRDRSRTQNISGNITNTGAGAFSLGDNYGEIANNINKLNFDNEHKNKLKQLLIQLANTVSQEDLDEEEKEESLEQINAIAEAMENSEDGVMKKTAKRAMRILRDIVTALPPTAAMVTICNQLPDAIAKIF